MRNLLLFPILLLGALPAAVSAQPAPLPSIELPAGLDRVLRDYERAWAAGDAAALARLFTEDGFVKNSAAGWVRGRSVIEAEYARAGGALRLRALAWETNGPVGYIVGAYGYGEEGGTDRGTFVLALRRDGDGPWLIAADLDSSIRPPQGGTPP